MKRIVINEEHIRPRRTEGPIADPPGLGDEPPRRGLANVLVWIAVAVIAAGGFIGIVLSRVM